MCAVEFALDTAILPALLCSVADDTLFSIIGKADNNNKNQQQPKKRVDEKRGEK